MSTIFKCYQPNSANPHAADIRVGVVINSTLCNANSFATTLVQAVHGVFDAANNLDCSLNKTSGYTIHESPLTGVNITSNDLGGIRYFLNEIKDISSDALPNHCPSSPPEYTAPETGSLTPKTIATLSIIALVVLAIAIYCIWKASCKTDATMPQQTGDVSSTEIAH